MKNIRDILNAHPLKPQVNLDNLVDCIGESLASGQICMTCADACLAEEDVKSLTECIRLNVDCGELCLSTAVMLSRLTDAPIELMRLKLQGCKEACRACAEECDRHEDRHEHCRLSAEACRRCESACDDLLVAIS